MKNFFPFIINNNLIINRDQIQSYDKMMYALHYNTGNQYIIYSFLKQLSDGNIDKFPSIQNLHRFNYGDTDRVVHIINEQCSHLLFMIQDAIRIGEMWYDFDKLGRMLKKIRKPVIVAGIGANSFKGFVPNFHQNLSSEIINFLKILADCCPVVGVRGWYTEEIFHNLGIDNVMAIGCPSFYEMGDERNLCKKEIDNLEDDIVLSSNVNIARIKNNYQICQCGIEEKIIRYIAFNELKQSMNDFEMQKIIDKKYVLFTNIEAWKDYLKHFKLTVGHRVHGSILSINAGVPAICTNQDTRASEMCEILSIPVVNPSDTTDIVALYNDSIDVDKMNASYKKAYDKYKTFLIKNGLQLQKNTILQQIDSISLYSPRETDMNNLKLCNQSLLIIDKINWINLRQEELRASLEDIKMILKQLQDNNNVTKSKFHFRAFLSYQRVRFLSHITFGKMKQHYKKKYKKLKVQLNKSKDKQKK